MQAIRIHEFGGPEVLSEDDVNTPSPAKEEILVKTRAAAYNPMDKMFREGDLEPEGPLPITLGGDIAGVVTETDDAVDEFSEGEEVYGTTAQFNLGGYSEYTIATPSTIAKKPENIDFKHAAAIPTVALTAYQAINDIATVATDDRVLIHGGAGGVGSFAVQFASIRGAEVIATASKTDLDYVRSLGAERVIDYNGTFESKVDDIDVVLDPVGGEVRTRSWKILNEHGKLITTTGPDPAEAPHRHDREGVLFFVDINSGALKRISDMFEKAQLEVAVGDTYPLSEAARLHAIAESDEAPQGKLVLEPDS